MNTEPDRIGRFSIGTFLGRGAFSEVYLAEDRDARRNVTMKLLDRRHLTSPNLVRRFNDEAGKLRELDGHGCVRVYDLGEHDGRPYFVMEYCEPGSLEDRLRQLGRRLTEAEASGLVVVLADLLGKLHRSDPSLVHRDIKPRRLLT